MLVLVVCLCPFSVHVVATFSGTVLFPLLCSVLLFFCLIHWFFSLSSFVIPSKCLKGINFTIKTSMVILVRVFVYGSVLVTHLFEEITSQLNDVKNRVFVCLSYVRSWHYWLLLSIVVWRGRVVLKLRRWWVSLFQASVWVTLFCVVFCVVVELRTYTVEFLNYIWRCVIKCNPAFVGQCFCRVISVNLLFCCVSFNKVFTRHLEHPFHRVYCIYHIR